MPLTLAQGRGPRSVRRAVYSTGSAEDKLELSALEPGDADGAMGEARREEEGIAGAFLEVDGNGLFVDVHVGRGVDEMLKEGAGTHGGIALADLASEEPIEAAGDKG